MFNNLKYEIARETKGIPGGAQTLEFTGKWPDMSLVTEAGARAFKVLRVKFGFRSWIGDKLPKDLKHGSAVL